MANNITKKEVKKHVKALKVGQGYNWGYVLSSDGSNYHCDTQKELINLVYKLNNDKDITGLHVTTFDEFGASHPPMPVGK